MKLRTRGISGTRNQAESERERAHRIIARKAAAEGIVLLENNGVLPLKKGSNVALYGGGARHTIKGGTGSGSVNNRSNVSIDEGLRNAGFTVTTDTWLDAYDAAYGQSYKEWKDYIYEISEPGNFDSLYRAHASHPMQMPKGSAITKTEAADAIYVISRISGEGADRKAEPGDYYLSEQEEEELKAITECYDNTIVILNVGGVMDVSFLEKYNIAALVMLSQAGMEGGNALADVLSGAVTPSGKLTDTWGCRYEDYPSSATFSHNNGNIIEEKYYEGIYVGYRYFDSFEVEPRYPFGYGMSYTTFDVATENAAWKPDAESKTITVTVKVTNTGSCAGKEVVQLYYGAPQGKLGKPAKELGAYRKTRLLQPGETQRVVLSFTVEDMASFDDLGKVAKSAYVLEAGSYVFYVGNNVRDAKKLDFTYDLAEAKVTAQYTSLAAPHKLEKRLLADGTYEALPTDNGPVEEEGLERQDKLTLEGFLPAVKAQERKSFGELMEAAKTNPNLMNVVEGKETLDEFVDKLPTEALIHLLGGQPNTGVANTFGMGNLPEYGIPNIMTADGPAGLRIQPQCGVNTTAWPCATLLACTWDPELIEEIGKAGGEEVKENNIGIWLTPAVNIHRSPLCGRNFEYYSEDPLVAGKSGAAMVRGMQSEHIGASVKHFCCNNKETNRKDSDSRVSERALREIYLKAFEIIVKEADPYTIMSSYNLINGVQASENKDLLTGILRGEWDFKGMVTTDWWTHGEHYRETKAGNDIKMANGYEERVQEAFEKGYITRDEIALCAKRILTMILRMD